MNTKYILLLTVICFCYPLKHCLQSMKVCNMYTTTVSHCSFGMGNQCLECEENYSVSNDRSKCVNVPNCRYFSEDGKCSQCDFYYNFDTNGNCVLDSCLFYDANRRCIQCHLGYYLNSSSQCEKISIKYCEELNVNNNNKCDSCFVGFVVENGNCTFEDNNYIEGCEEKNTDGTCKTCKQNYNLNNGKCTFNNNCGESNQYEMCFACEEGYYLSDRSYHCVSMNGTKDTEDTDNENDSNTVSDDSTSNGNIVKGININFVLFYLFLALI